MAVFKAYMKIARKNIWMILLYLGIFFCVTILFQRFVPEGAEGYTAESVPVGIVDEDGGEAAESLINYIGRTNETILLEDDRESLQEDLFYRNVRYIVRIPEGFMEKCILGEEKIEAVTVPGTYAGYYVDQQVNSYMVYARSYAAAGFTETEIASAMAHRDKAEVTLVDFSGNAGLVPAYTCYYRYLPYLRLSVRGYGMGYILMGFRRGIIPQRMRASAVPGRRQSVEGLAASLVIALALWGVSAAVSVVMYRQDIFESGKLIWYLLNSLVMMLTALSLAYLVGTLVKSSNALSGIVNIISLGMCFVCGVFVEISYLSAEVRKAAQFLPVYWYETVNTLLTDHRTVAGSIRSEVLSGIGIQIVFAIAFVCVTLAVAKRSRRSS